LRVTDLVTPQRDRNAIARSRPSSSPRLNRWAADLLAMPARFPRPLPRIAIRVGGAFVVILALFGTALAVTLGTSQQLAAADQGVATLDEAKHAGHQVAALVREQYIHQAHTIIEGDRSHLDHYLDWARKAREATLHLRSFPLTTEESTRARDITRRVVELDERFRTEILPAVDARDHKRVHERHGQMETLVGQVVAMSEALNRQIEGRADRARQDEERLRRRAGFVVVGCFILAIGVTIAAWLVLGQSVLKRLGELRQGALSVSAGRLDVRVTPRGSDELSDLATTFNEMAASLSEQHRRIAQSERLTLLGQLAAGVAHEINNPLGVILGYAKLLQKQATDAQAQPLRIIEDETRQCQRIVQGLLDLARPVSANRSRVDVAASARDAVDRLLQGGQVNGRSIEIPASATQAFARADENALRQVISNLVLNALEATSPEGSVKVSVREGNEHIELEVEDDGPGIPGEVLPHVFEPFFTTKPKGTGLGLAISHAIVSAHEGSLDLVSDSTRGTRAILRIPAYRGDARTEVS
jgi:two-component system NtrC family sensor kinase